MEDATLHVLGKPVMIRYPDRLRHIQRCLICGIKIVDTDDGNKIRQEDLYVALDVNGYERSEISTKLYLPDEGVIVKVKDSGETSLLGFTRDNPEGRRCTWVGHAYRVKSTTPYTCVASIE